MNSLKSYHLLVRASLIFSFGLFYTTLIAQNNRMTTVFSLGNSYLTDIKSFELGTHGVEASAEVLLNKEKIGIKIPINLYFQDDLYLGTGINLRFYTNKGKIRGFVGPNLGTGRNVTDRYDDEEEFGPLRYLLLTGDVGLAYHTKKLAVALHAGFGREYKYKDYITNFGISIGLKF